MNYILGIDQSTQGTKAFLFDENGVMIRRADMPHRQITNELGWVSHDLNEIYDHVLQLVRDVTEGAQINKDDIVTVGITNQRETSCAWDRQTGRPIADAIVWQCGRAAKICNEDSIRDCAEKIRRSTGLQLSPFFPAGKYAWFIRNVEGAKAMMDRGELLFGTIDSYLIYRLTNGESYKTDYSNASRTQLFNLNTLSWDEEICGVFGIVRTSLPEVCDSDACFGRTDFGGFLNHPIPIHAALGDSHAAFFAHGCNQPGMAKATIGTGSSVMMNIGDSFRLSENGLVTSLAYGIGGKVSYVLEGNINYAAAVITWLKDDLHMIDDPAATAGIASIARQEDTTYLVPAFTGLGAPYWDNDVRAAFIGMSRTTGRNELVKAALESIAYQINDIVSLMAKDARVELHELRIDGGAAKNPYLAQFQSDIGSIQAAVSASSELSGTGAAYLAGISFGVMKPDVLENLEHQLYQPIMPHEEATARIDGWKAAVAKCLNK